MQIFLTTLPGDVTLTLRCNPRRPGWTYELGEAGHETVWYRTAYDAACGAIREYVLTRDWAAADPNDAVEDAVTLYQRLAKQLETWLL